MLRIMTLSRSSNALSTCFAKFITKQIIPLPCSRPKTTLSFYGTDAQPSSSLRDPRLEEIVNAAKSRSSIHKKNRPEENNNINHKLEAHSDVVPSDSSMRQIFENSQVSKPDKNEEVPRDSLYIGAAGVLPYAATSISTIYLAWDINHSEITGSGFLFAPETAHHLLEMITPIQIGYGAIIISFLGAVHWGLEYAQFGGRHSYRRLVYGVVAPMIAWPTLLMPVEAALISQFLGFNFMYFVDARATASGWFPPWYSIYRFVLTFMVGASLVVSLIARGQITSPEKQHLKSLLDNAKYLQDSKYLESKTTETTKSSVVEDAES